MISPAGCKSFAALAIFALEGYAGRDNKTSRFSTPFSHWRWQNPVTKKQIGTSGTGCRPLRCPQQN
jgi:hypothetical protein